jgi:hypothetical protein
MFNSSGVAKIFRKRTPAGVQQIMPLSMTNDPVVINSNREFGCMPIPGMRDGIFIAMTSTQSSKPRRGDI